MNISDKREIYKLNKVQWSLGLLLVASPWILLFITTNIIAHQSVFNSAPCWSDELAYWHEVLSFSQKGFDFGYYSMNEMLPNYLSFGTHGFGAVSVYALFGKVLGYKACSLVITNAFCMSLAFLILIIQTKTSSKNTLLILIFSLTYVPLVLFVSTSMAELLNYSVLVVYVGLLYAYFRRNGKKRFAFLFVFCTAISFIRIIYIILFIPLLFKRKKEFKFDRKFLIYSVLWLLFSVLLFLLNSLFVSPYPDSFLNELLSGNSFSDFVRNFAIHFVQNAWNLMNPVSENLIQVLQRYFILSVSLICLVKSNLFQSRFKKITIEYFIVFLVLFLFLFINIAVYDVSDWRDYRVLSPVLFSCVVFLILSGKLATVNFSLAVNLLGLIFLIFSSEIFESFNKERYSKLSENKVLNHIRYTENPTTRFQNTIVVQNFTKDIVLNIPAGIGISCSDNLSDKLKSNYLFSEYKLKLSTYKIIDSNETGYLYQKIVLH